MKNINNYYFKIRTSRFRWIYLSYLGMKEKGRRYYWKVFFWTLLHRPKLFPAAITYSITGFHFRKIFGVGKAFTKQTD